MPKRLKTKVFYGNDSTNLGKALSFNDEYCFLYFDFQGQERFFFKADW